MTLFNSKSKAIIHNDPLLKAASHLFDIYTYQPKPAPWHNLLVVLTHHGAFITVLAFWLYGFSRLNKGPLRSFGAIAGLSAMFLEPVVYGRSGIHIVDFGMPSYAFLGFLHIVDVFFLRPIDEVHEWGMGRTLCQIFAYVNEDSDGKQPRTRNAKVLVLCFLKYVGVNLCLYAVPPPHVWAQIKPFSFAWSLHSGVMGLVILGTLGFFIEAVVRLIGIGFGIEMSPMFNNPSGASNIRDFWARWNMVIKDGLSRVFFHFKAPPSKRRSGVNGTGTALSSAVSQVSSAASSKISGNGSNGGGLRKRGGGSVPKTDYLSETDVSEADSRPGSPEGGKPSPIVAKKAKGGRKKSPFFPKACSAMLTFVASGLFHEYMNHIGFEGASGETVLFFIVQATATIVYSYLARTFPQQLSYCPKWLGIILTNVVAFGSAPLFVAPFLRAGVFEDFKAGGIFGPVKGFVWLAGDGYGHHAPKLR